MPCQPQPHRRRFLVFADFNIIVKHPENIQHLSDDGRVVRTITVPLPPFAAGRGDGPFQKGNPPPDLHEESVDSVKRGFHVKAGQMIVVIGAIPKVGQPANRLLRLTHVGEGIEQPLVVPLADVHQVADSLSHDDMAELIIRQGFVGRAGRPEIRQGAEALGLEETFLVDRQLLVDPHEEGIATLFQNFFPERREAGGPDPRFLIHVESKLADPGQ